MKIIRVFPCRTKATPTDRNVYIGLPDMFAKANKIHISVTFSWDLPEAERLYKAWRYIAQTEIGGVATGMRSEEFRPGMYLKEGYVITSRGCPNRCWFCSVWRREGETIRELPVTNGWNILDDNLLACSERHIKQVFEMLSKQNRKPEFTGGLEAARLKAWHIEGLKKVNPQQLFFAYDTPSDRDALYEAGKLLHQGGFKENNHVLRAYVLIGYAGDTFEKAEKRLLDCIEFGFMPMAMLYRDECNIPVKEWKQFQRLWARPSIIAGKLHSHKKSNGIIPASGQSAFPFY